MNDMEFPPMELPAEEAQLAIFVVTRYQNAKGFVIHTHDCIETGATAFIGTITIGLANAQGEQQQVPVDFRILASDIRHAFQTFEEAAKIAANTFMEQIQAQQRKAMLTQGLNGMANGMPKHVTKGNFNPR